MTHYAQSDDGIIGLCLHTYTHNTCMELYMYTAVSNTGVSSASKIVELEMDDPLLCGLMCRIGIDNRKNLARYLYINRQEQQNNQCQ